VEPKVSLPHSKQSATRPSPRVSIQSKISHTSFKIHFNIILTSTPGSSKWLLSFRFPHQTLCAFRFSPYVPHAPPISSSMISLTQYYLVSDPDHCTFPSVLCHLVLLKHKYLPQHPVRGPGWLSRHSDSLWAGRSMDRNPIRARFSAPVQTGTGAHPASYTIHTESLSGGKAAGAWS